jgi:hypothetical protein
VIRTACNAASLRHAPDNTSYATFITSRLLAYRAERITALPDITGGEPAPQRASISPDMAVSSAAQYA